MKTCYYELLGVDRKASEDDIKKVNMSSATNNLAYKKMALKYHPDKNREVDTKEIFQSLNAAYEVLIDTHERAWYDSHREQILKGTDGEELSKEDMEQATYGFNIWPYFSSSCFKGFDETVEKNFFSVYGKVFEKIIQDEAKAFRFSQDSEENEEKFIHYETPPDFGTSTSGVDHIQAFYRFWGSFSSYKSFSWCDSYNVTEAPNRWVKRQMDKENKKERLTEKRTYVKTIKELVEFCKRRDPRWKDFQDAQRLQEEKKKEELKIKKELELKRKQQSKGKAREEEEKRWAELDAEKEKNGENSGLLPDEDQYVDEFFCEMCSKGFKCEAQLHNHNNSKGHKRKMKELLEEVGMANEKAVLGDTSASDAPSISKKKKKKQRKYFQQQSTSSLGGIGQEEGEDQDNEENFGEQEDSEAALQSEPSTQGMEKDSVVESATELQGEQKDETPIPTSKWQIKKARMNAEKAAREATGTDSDTLPSFNTLTVLPPKPPKEIKKKAKGGKKKGGATEKQPQQEEQVPEKDVEKVKNAWMESDDEERKEQLLEEEEEEEEYYVKEYVEVKEEEDEWASVGFNTIKQQNKFTTAQQTKKKQEEANIKLMKQAEENRLKALAKKNRKKANKKMEDKSEDNSNDESDDEDDQDLVQFAQNIKKRNVEVIKDDEDDKRTDKGKKGKRNQDDNLDKNNKKDVDINKLSDKEFNKWLKTQKKDTPNPFQEEETQAELNKAKLKKLKKKENEDKEKELGQFKCNSCPLRFQTKNKLFSHIKETGHELKV